jgi:hypothetical protein
MMHFVYDTFMHLPLSGSFNGSTGRGSASRREIIFNTNSSQNTANQQVQNRILGTSLQSSSEPDNHSANRQQGIAPIVPKWTVKRHEIAAINELPATKIN